MKVYDDDLGAKNVLNIWDVTTHPPYRNLIMRFRCEEKLEDKN
jgi:hypothetical protein